MSENPTQPSFSRRQTTADQSRLQLGFAAVYLAGGARAGGGCFFSGWIISIIALTHESTDDAFIAGHIVSIAPRIAGQVSAVHVLDNQLVRSNDLLVEIDPSDYAITVAQKQAAAASQDANFRTVIAAYELMRAKVTTAKASALKAQADADAAGATARKAQSDFARAQDLLKQKTISQQEFDSAACRQYQGAGGFEIRAGKCGGGNLQGGRGGKAARRRVRGKRHGVLPVQRGADQRRVGAIKSVLHENPCARATAA